MSGWSSRHRLLIVGLLFGVSAGHAMDARAQLADAVMRGDKDVLRSLPPDRKAINAPQPDGTTALHWAVRRDDLAGAGALIKAGADVRAVTRYGITPMNFAAMNGNAAMVRL